VKKSLFFLGLAAFGSYPFLGLVVPATLGFFLMIGAILPEKASHYHW
jgi:hypothetical protein